MTSAHDVAAAVVRRTGAITTMKLQKLVYYSQAWHLVFHGEPMFEERIEAWQQGPVTPSLYARHSKKYQVQDWPHGSERELTAEQLSTLDWVLGKYAHFSAEALSRMTHMETPWRSARGLCEEDEKSTAQISQDQMRYFYARQRTDPDIAVAQAAASSAMEGVDLDDEWQQTLREVATGARSADDLIAEEIRRAQSQ
ncbi:Panacea domain-containing protein [Amycolatopsis sp. cg5]|uniref:Panacea domain-containing protein n=1 Tax=Amycolatopsis sp. cg5 TaxID=3238802 RepID=UPI0035242419